MAYNLKETSLKPERLTGGHRMCAGCGAPVVARSVLRALKPEDKAVITSATGCLEVSTFIYPYTAVRSFLYCCLPGTTLPSGDVVVSAYFGVADER